MATFLESSLLATRYVPGPSMERGHALNIYAHPKEGKLIYAFSKYVVVRSLEKSTENFVYRGHKFPVGVAQFSPSGFWVASGDAGGFLRVWSWDNPEHMVKLEAQVLGGGIADLAWDGESKRICVVGDGKGVVSKCVMWDTGNTVGEMVGHSKRVITCAYRQSRPFRIMTGSEDFRVVFYKGPPFKMDHSASEHKNYVNCVRYSPSGEVIASVGSDKRIVLYEGKEGTVALGDLRPGDKKAAHQGSIYSCAFSPDGRLLLTASADKSVKVWVVPPLEGAPASCAVSSLSLGADVGAMQNAVVWPPAGPPVSVSLCGEVNYLSIADEAIAGVSKVVVAPQAPISAMTVVSGDVVVAGCNDGTVFAIRPDSDEWTKLAAGGAAKPGSSPARPCHTGKVTALCAAPASTELAFASAGFDDKIRLATLEAYVAEVEVDGQPNALGALDENALVFATTKGVGRLALAPALAVAAFRPTPFDPTALAVGAGDVVLGAKDGSLRVLDPTSLDETRQLTPHRGEITAAAFSPDRAYLAVGDADREIKLYAPADGYAVALHSLWRFHTARVTALAWHPASTHLASTGNDEAIFVWSCDKTQATPIKVDFAHKDGVTALAWRAAQSPNLVSVGNDGCACVWNPLG